MLFQTLGQLFDNKIYSFKIQYILNHSIQLNVQTKIAFITNLLLFLKKSSKQFGDGVLPFVKTLQGHHHGDINKKHLLK